jgi:hypothetical protein
MVSQGLRDLRVIEESFLLDFDEWFDRGSSSRSKADVRGMILGGPGARGFFPTVGEADRLLIECWRSVLRGVVAEAAKETATSV